ncbi:type II secretion system minor pseudopilin GspK [Candidatus Hydrogenedentota bacterium]
MGAERREKNEDGMALILAVIVVALLAVMIMEFNFRTRVSASLGQNALESLQAENVSRSGVALFLGELRRDLEADIERDPEKLTDWVGEEWMEGMVDIEVGEEGLVSVEISDEDGKLNLNLLQLPPSGGASQGIQTFQGLLESLDVVTEDEIEPQALTAALVDWIDNDDEPAMESADPDTETYYYQDLEVPYRCKNGPLDTIRELLLVKGFTRRIVYGDDDTPGLNKYVTVHGARDGAMNINTMEEELIEAWFNQMGEAAAGMLYGVGEEIAVQRDSNPFTDMDDLKQRVARVAHAFQQSQQVVPQQGAGDSAQQQQQQQQQEQADKPFKFSSECFAARILGVYRGSPVKINTTVERKQKEDEEADEGGISLSTGRSNAPEDTNIQFRTLAWRISR